ncbi:MAG: hypothetical protein AAGU11_10845 [Syntrophobacteraceae bacterium]
MFFFIAIALFIALVLIKGRLTLHERIYPRLYGGIEFPEDFFPAKNETEYRKKVLEGFRNIRCTSVVICAITRNDAEVLPLTIGRIEKLGSLFSDYRVIVFENDSIDATPDILKRWEKANSRVKILSGSLRGSPVAFGTRTEKLAWFRNRYLDEMRNSAEYESFNYVIVLDMDLKGGWSYDGVASSFSRLDWDAAASNSIGYHNLRRTYYDTYALKPESILTRGLSGKILGNGSQIQRNGSFIEVRSAFGGLCVYRKDKLLSRKYSGILEGRPVSEHVPLNSDGSMKFILNPSQITLTGTQEDKEHPARLPWTRSLRLMFLNW